MDVYGLRLSKRAMSGRDTAWGIPKQAYVSRVLANIRKEER